MPKQITVQLPDETHERLQALAQRSGRSESFHIRQAIEDYLEDQEDIELAERAMKEIRNGNEKTISLDELIAELGLQRELGGKK